MLHPAIHTLACIPHSRFEQKGLPSPRCTYHGSIIQQHIRRVPQLAANRRIPQHRIHPLCIAGYCRSLEVLDELADAHQLARETELLLGRLEGRDAGLRMVCAV